MKTLIKQMLASVLLFAISGCATHPGKWVDGKSFLYETDDAYILDTGEKCGEVVNSHDNLAYFSFVHGGSEREWETLAQAKSAITSDWRCK